MKLFHIISILSVVHAVSTVDLYFWPPRSDCTSGSGTTWVCTNMNPTDCCTHSPNSNGKVRSISFLGIPTDWRLNLGVYYEADCKNLQAAVQIQRGTFYCFSAPYGESVLKSGSYDFPARKRALESTSLTAGAAKECRRPDIMRLADGTEFSLAALNDKAYNDLVC
jgi:hypothetical protein